MNVKFLKGSLERYQALTSKDANTLYFITNTGALYLGEKLIGKDYDASILALQNLIGEVPEGYASLRAYVDSIVTGSGYVTVGVMEAAIKEEADRAKGIEEGLRTDVDAIKGDYLTSVDKTALQDEIDADVKVVSDALAAYKTSNDAEVAAIRVIAEAATTVDEVNAQIDAKITAENLNQYTTEQEVKDIVDNVIAGAADSETYNSLTKLVDYIDAHGGEAADMAEAIDALEKKVVLGTYVEGEETKEYETVKAYVEAAIAALSIDDYAKTGDLGALASKNTITTNDIDDGAVTKAKLVDDVQESLSKADTALQEHQDISGKADKVSGATEGNFAGLDASGNLTDSGKKAADFATAAQGTKADSAVQSVSLASGSTNGTVKLTVDSTVTDNIKVTGLGSAAYVETTAFDAAGAADAAAAAVQGSTTNTVKDCVDAINKMNNVIEQEVIGNVNNLTQQLADAKTDLTNQDAAVLAEAQKYTDNALTWGTF